MLHNVKGNGRSIRKPLFVFAKSTSALINQNQLWNLSFDRHFAVQNLDAEFVMVSAAKGKRWRLKANVQSATK
jgi:hypothetical protein